MKFALSLLIFTLLSTGAAASWQSYQNGLRNTGSSGEIGHFPLNTINFTNDNYGMDFQPLADNLDASGNNEIVIFSNDSLIIFDPQLNILSQAKVGSILGQPTLFNLDSDSFIEIIFNARQGLNDYFLAYQYGNSDLRQEFNITLPNEANFSGIKCLALDNVPSCIFKDRKNYVHIINLESKNYALYNTSVYNESRQTVPAIGDVDNDGNYEAVFWFNEDNSGGYGFLAFDLSERKVDWIADNIFSPLILGTLEIHQLFKLKGQPVLVDLNNDNKLEIAASVFYDDSANADSTTDWFTELFVYAGNGSKLFSKCEKNQVLNSGCNDGDNQVNKWEGTNPFVLDYDKDGIDDICFAKDVKTAVGRIGFYYMALNCYNYDGNEIAKVNLSNSEDGVKGTAMTADMNNDGEKEIITSNSMYSLNGKSIFDYPLDTFNPIAVDMDGNGGLDLIWTKGSQTKVFLDSNNYSIDLAVSSSDINFLKIDKTHVNVSALIRNYGQLEAKNVKVAVYNAETLENNTAIFDLRGNGNLTFSSILALKEGEKVLVSVDYDNEIKETDETNNFAFREFEGLPYVYVSVGAEQNPQLAMQEIKNYIKNSLIAGYSTENEGSADIKIYIGKTNGINLYDRFYTMDKYGWGYESLSIINYFDKQFDAPYAGIVGSYLLNGQHYIAIYGNQIDGDIAAAKEFIKRQADFIANPEMAFVIDDENVEAIGVFDYLHQPGNEQFYGDNSASFANAVKSALNGEMFSSEIKNVMTADNVQLRLKHLIPNRSSTYIEILNATGVPVGMPVVLSRGVHSNLTTWEVLAGELADSGRDTWLIEITGGPGQDCDSCPNYNFADLTNSYWPTLINGVLIFTGKDKVQYVGHSNGGRVGIISLTNGEFDSSKIDTFIGVAVPSAFEGYSPFAHYFGKYGEQVMEELQGKSHVSMTEIGDKLRRICLSNFGVGCGTLTLGLKSDDKMSFNTDKQYYLWIINNTDTQIGKNLQLSNFYLIQGWVKDDNESNIGHDFIVTEQDEQAIYDNIISSNKKHYKVWGAHTAGWDVVSLPDRSLTKSIIKDALNKKSLNKYKSNEISTT